MKDRPKSDSPTHVARKGRALSPLFVAYELDLLTSPAWAAAPEYTRRLLHRLEVEHLRNGRSCNGALAVSHSQFADPADPNHIRKQTVRLAILIGEALGLLQVTRRGYLTEGDVGVTSTFRLTYVWGRKNGKRDDPTDEWRRFATRAEAEDAVAAVRTRVDREKARRRKAKVERKPEKKRAA